MLPSFWKSSLDVVDEFAKTATLAEVTEIARSAGNRPIRAFRYGQRQNVESRANYNSACGAKDRTAFVNPADKKPVVMLVGAVHGQETEAIAALLNLISLLETGRDMGGVKNSTLAELAGKVRLVIVPVANPDGRARVVPEAMVGLTNDEMRRWGQGTWKDGSLCSWPDCKKVHPIKDAVDFLGGYFNDDGINLMHDQFFKPMARETQALFDIAIEEFADCILLLHGGSNSQNELLPTAYAPVEVNERFQALSKRCDERAQKEGLAFKTHGLPPMPSGETPPSFNLTSALHHATGADAAVFESNQHIADYPGSKLSYEQIYRSHIILFEETISFYTEIG